MTGWLTDDRVAVGLPGEDAVLRTRRALPELVFLAEPVDRIGVVDAEVEGASVPREPRVDAVRAAVLGAVGRTDERVAEHLGLAAGVGDRGPVLRVRPVTEGDVEDPDRLLASPVVVVERATER